MYTWLWMLKKIVDSKVVHVTYLLCGNIMYVGITGFFLSILLNWTNQLMNCLRVWRWGWRKLRDQTNSFFFYFGKHGSNRFFCVFHIIQTIFYRFRNIHCISLHEGNIVEWWNGGKKFAHMTFTIYNQYQQVKRVKRITQ